MTENPQLQVTLFLLGTFRLSDSHYINRYIFVLFSPIVLYFCMNLTCFLRSDVLLVGKPSEKD